MSDGPNAHIWLFAVVGFGKFIMCLSILTKRVREYITTKPLQLPGVIDLPKAETKFVKKQRINSSPCHIAYARLAPV